MTIRIRESNVVAVQLDDGWYSVKPGSLLVEPLAFPNYDSTTEPEQLKMGFVFTLADQEANMIAGPFSSIKSVKLVKE